MIAKVNAFAEFSAAVTVDGRLDGSSSKAPLPIDRSDAVSLIVDGRSHGNVGPLCTATLAPLEPHVPWERELLQARFDCYKVTGNPLAGRAEADLQRIHQPCRRPVKKGATAPS